VFEPRTAHLREAASDAASRRSPLAALATGMAPCIPGAYRLVAAWAWTRSCAGFATRWRPGLAEWRTDSSSGGRGDRWCC
jgi:hypothetical protein